MSKSRFSIVEVKRAAKALKDAGWPVENYGLRVDGAGWSLLPVANINASDAPELDDELAEWRRTHAHG